MRISETMRNLPALKARAQIPLHKRRSQWLRTIAGGVVFLGGFALPHFASFPWQGAAAVSGFGAFLASQQLVTDFVKALVQAVQAIVGAVGGKGPPSA